MLRIIALTVFLSIIGVLIYRNRGSLPELKTSFRKLDWWLSLAGIRPEQVTDDWRSLISFLIKGSFIVLAITGFIPLVLFGAAVSGFVLILHVLTAPVFALSLVIVSLLRAHDHRFTKNDWQSLQQVIGRKPSAKKSNPQTTAFGKKVIFWLILLLALPLILSILLSMYPLMGTEGQEALIQLHGYSALLLVTAAVLWLYWFKLGDN